MNKPPVKYNPAFLSDEDLVRTFVVRHDDLNMISSVIRENTTDSNQHVLVIGPRGIGKTMLVRRIALTVQQDDALNQKWYPLTFAEESYEVASAGEFWLEALFHLGHQTGDTKWTRAYEDLKREPVESRLHDRALAQLMDFADSQGKRILLIVENLNMILGEQLSDDHAWKLRHTLMHERRVMLLATATTRLDLPENTNKAMFELFKSQVLRPLNDTECQALWLSATGEELGPRRIRAISILTGGNPRLLAIISRFGTRLSFAELMADMTGLVDDHTDYFKSHLDALPPTERKVYVSLADLWDPATSREVALVSRLGVSMTSSLLKRLINRGAVLEIPGEGRTKRYQVAERMYNIYYLMRRRGSPSDRVRHVVQFMVQFYEEKELVDAAKRLTEEACHLSREDRECHYHAFENIVRAVSPNLRSKILRCASHEFLDAPDRPKSLLPWIDGAQESGACPCGARKSPNQNVAELIKRGFRARREDRLEEAKGFFIEAITLDDTYAEAWRLLGRVEAELPDRKPEAEKAYRRAAELAPDDPCVWDDFGRFLMDIKGREDESEQAFKKALESYPDCSDAWIGLGRLYSILPGRKPDSAEAYRAAEAACMRRIDQYPDQVSGWRMLAHIRHRYTNRFVDAESAYRKALDLDGAHVQTWTDLGMLLSGQLKRYEDAEIVFRKAIALDPTAAKALGNLACLLNDHLGKREEAETLFLKVTTCDLKYAHQAWRDLGRIYEQNARYEEAEQAYRKAIETKPDHACPWGQLGRLLQFRLKRYDEAESAYRKVIELAEHKVEWAWLDLGILHEQVGRYQEAEYEYRKAIELTPTRAEAWALLGSLLHERLGRYEEAEAAYRKAIQLRPNQAETLTRLGDLLFERVGRIDEAEQVYLEAVKADNRNVPAQTALVTFALKGRGRPDQALEFAQQALKDIPKNGRLLNGLAWAFYEFGPSSCLFHAEEWSSQSITLESTPESIHTFVCVLARSRRVSDALTRTAGLLNSTEFVANNIDEMVRLFGELVAIGEAAKAHLLLRDSKSASILEPVAVALQMHLGTEVHVAPEIAEVAKDVLKRFQEIVERRKGETKE